MLMRQHISPRRRIRPGLSPGQVQDIAAADRHIARSVVSRQQGRIAQQSAAAAVWLIRQLGTNIAQAMSMESRGNSGCRDQQVRRALQQPVADLSPATSVAWASSMASRKP